MRVSTFQNANWAKNQLMDLNVQQQYHRNQVTSGKKNLLMSEDHLRQVNHLQFNIHWRILNKCKKI